MVVFKQETYSDTHLIFYYQATANNNQRYTTLPDSRSAVLDKTGRAFTAIIASHCTLNFERVAKFTNK